MIGDLIEISKIINDFVSYGHNKLSKNTIYITRNLKVISQLPLGYAHDFIIME